MKVNTVIRRNPTRLEYATVQLAFQDEQETYQSQLNFNFQEFRIRFPLWRYTSRISLEFLLLAHIVYVVDKMVPRKNAVDEWTRDLDVSVPTQCRSQWNAIKNHLEELISFLTGDHWTFDFYDHQFSIGCPPRDTHRSPRIVRTAGVDAVSLFSGGLDSLIGVIDWLEENPSKSIFLMGHHDSSGPNSQQNTLFRHLQEVYSRRVCHIGLLANQKEGQAKENSFRSRSFLFIALGVLCAQQFRDGTPLLIPENGTISLNVPLNSARRGSLSTRTCHPYFLSGVSDILSRLGIMTPILNPLSGKTKGECVAQCLNQELLRIATPDSVSCGKAGRKTYWDDKLANACGVCVPCIFRRAALHQVRIDTQAYGHDFTTVNGHELDDVNLDKWDDLRAILSFLRHNYSMAELKRILISSGPLEVSELSDYAALVGRAMEEVREFLRENASIDVQEAAGLI